jgi:drug/metabolite transporter (DMT)-like permease
VTTGIALQLLTVMVLWALCFPLITIGLDLAPHLAFAAMRALLAGLMLLLMALISGEPLPKGGRMWGLILVVGFGSTSLGFFGMFHAAEFVSPGLATVMANAQPLAAAMLAQVFLREELSAIGKSGLAIGFIGIIGMAWPGLASGVIRGELLGIAYILLAVSGVAVGNVAMKRLSTEIGATMGMGLQLFAGAVPLMLLSTITEDPSSVAWSGTFIIVLVTLSLFGTAIAFWLWFAALKRVDLSQANAFTFLVSVFGLAIGATFFNERLTLLQAGSTMLIIVGIALVQLHTRRASGSIGSQ